MASWFDDMSDTELLDLVPYLEKLSLSKDIYVFLRQNPHPLSLKREQAGGAGNMSISDNSIATVVPATSLALPSTSAPTSIIASVEKPGIRRLPMAVVSSNSSGNASPGSSSEAAGGDSIADNCIQQLTKAAGRLAVHESVSSSSAASITNPVLSVARSTMDARYDSSSSSTSSFSKTGDCAGCLATGAPVTSADYSFNAMVSNGNGGASGPGGDALLYTPGSVKTP